MREYLSISDGEIPNIFCRFLRQCSDCPTGAIGVGPGPPPDTAAPTAGALALTALTPWIAVPCIGCPVRVKPQSIMF